MAFDPFLILSTLREEMLLRIVTFNTLKKNYFSIIEIL